MKNSFKFLVFILSITSLVQSQTKDGYWDNIRTTNQTFTLKTGEIKIINSEEFPEGTTEFVYRITTLNKNQQISSSLTSLLKSIPDPTGISQGAAGGVFLLSTISGEDKSKYIVFSSKTAADLYSKSQKIENACFVQEKPINKEAKVLSIQNNCFTATSNSVWFAFESDNWVMNQTIVLEIVPWVDVKLSRGWNTNSKSELLSLCKNQKVYPILTKKDAFSAQFIDKISQKYTRKEFNSLIPVEKNQFIETITEQILTKTGDIDLYYDLIRKEAKTTFDKGNKDAAIALLQKEFFNKKRATAIDYYQLSNYYLISKQFDKAEKICNEGIQLDATEISLHLQMAHIYMFTNRMSDAKMIHEKYKFQNINSSTSWIDQTKSDFLHFEKNKFPTNDFKKIIRILD
jgi:tetratricopeptide (TPR) repeat protein